MRSALKNLDDGQCWILTIGPSHVRQQLHSRIYYCR